MQLLGCGRDSALAILLCGSWENRKSEGQLNLPADMCKLGYPWIWPLFNEHALKVHVARHKPSTISHSFPNILTQSPRRANRHLSHTLESRKCSPKVLRRRRNQWLPAVPLLPCRMTLTRCSAGSGVTQQSWLQLLCFSQINNLGSLGISVLK